ncbi:MAG: 2-C-methyl-D-erythritol 2,4-cyclodiphosphate synthase [Bacillota bacterium]
MRVGIGFDVHQLVEGRPLIIGGVTLPFHLGLEGHSDADVLLHALMDALLGAASLGDIGGHFPDTDPGYKGISSVCLLEVVMEKIWALGFQVNNIDGVIIAEKPKLLPHLNAMVELIARVLSISPESVNLKATTMEKLGPIGRGEGIAAQVVVSLKVEGRR